MNELIMTLFFFIDLNTPYKTNAVEPPEVVTSVKFKAELTNYNDRFEIVNETSTCLLYTSDAADE